MNDYRKLRRYHIGSESLPIQEVDGMYVTKVYWDIYDVGKFIKQKMSIEDQEKFADCDIIPIDISFDNCDLTYTATLGIGKNA